MEPNFNDLAYLDQYDQHSQASFRHINAIKQKPQMPTDAFERKQKIVTRSIKKLNGVSKSMRSIQNFSLDQHKLYVQKKYQKFEKFVTQKIQEFQVPQVQIEINHDKLIIEELINEVDILTNQEKMQFFQDLKYEEDLKCFLEILAQIFDQEIVKDLAIIAHKCWEQYVNLTGRELLPYCSQLLESEGKKCSIEKFDQILNSKFKILLKWQKLNLDKSLIKEIEEQFKQFVISYCKTVLLVIGGYFYNPMFHRQGFREQQVVEESMFTFAKTYSNVSQDESQFLLRMIPQKKKKTN